MISVSYNLRILCDRVAQFVTFTCMSQLAKWNFWCLHMNQNWLCNFKEGTLRQFSLLGCWLVMKMLCFSCTGNSEAGRDVS